MEKAFRKSQILIIPTFVDAHEYGYDEFDETILGFYLVWAPSKDTVNSLNQWMRRKGIEPSRELHILIGRSERKVNHTTMEYRVTIHPDNLYLYRIHDSTKQWLVAEVRHHPELVSQQDNLAKRYGLTHGIYRSGGERIPLHMTLSRNFPKDHPAASIRMMKFQIKIDQERAGG
jgi:hypothetical protein